MIFVFSLRIEGVLAANELEDSWSGHFTWVESWPTVMAHAIPLHQQCKCKFLLNIFYFLKIMAAEMWANEINLIKIKYVTSLLNLWEPCQKCLVESILWYSHQTWMLPVEENLEFHNCNCKCTNVHTGKQTSLYLLLWL